MIILHRFLIHHKQTLSHYTELQSTVSASSAALKVIVGWGKRLKKIPPALCLLKQVHAPCMPEWLEYILCACMHVICVFSLHPLVPQHHCRSSTPACALGCWRTERILGRRAQRRQVWRTKKMQRNRRARTPLLQKHSDWQRVSSGHAASPQMYQTLEQHSPPAKEWETKTNDKTCLCYALANDSMEEFLQCSEENLDQALA